MQKKHQQDQSQLKWISDFIWNIANDRLRDVYVRGKYRDVILPFTVLRRLDAVLEETKDAVLECKKFLDTNTVAEQDGALRMSFLLRTLPPPTTATCRANPLITIAMWRWM